MSKRQERLFLGVFLTFVGWVWLDVAGTTCLDARGGDGGSAFRQLWGPCSILSRHSVHVRRTHSSDSLSQEPLGHCQAATLHIWVISRFAPTASYAAIS